ncbi:hypothetical protein OAE41_00635, partial [bacterium]|nr:hypothetical protein [bacterium]
SCSVVSPLGCWFLPSLLLLNLPLIKKTAVLTQELLSLTPRRFYRQPHVLQHQEIGSQVANERVSGCGIPISIVWLSKM